MKKVSVSIPEEVYQDLRDEAIVKNISLSKVIREKILQKDKEASLRDTVINKYSSILPGLKENLVGAILIDVDDEKLLHNLRNGIIVLGVDDKDIEEEYIK